jgi:hypothetical protein
MRRRYEAWETEDGHSFFVSDQLSAHERNPAEKLVKKLFEVEADTFEEALSIYYLRMGRGPFTPVGDPEQCPTCGGWFYPQGSGECWRCGKIS